MSALRLINPIAAPQRMIASSKGSRNVKTNVLGRNETKEAAVERRLRESDAVSERVKFITTVNDLDAAISSAKDKLLVIEVSSETLCQLDANHDLPISACQGVKHSFQRTARDCPDAEFLEVVVDGPEGEELLDNLGVEVVPTVQFVKDGRLLWEHRGVTNLDTDLSEGVLFYGDSGAGGFHATDVITEIHNRADLDKWVAGLGDKELGVLDVSVSGAAACVHIFPTVVVLARQFKGFASFARLMGDTNEETQALMKELGTTQAPTFFFYRNGEPCGTHIGSSRGDLISAILGKQAELGLTPPPPTEGRRERRRHAAEDAKAAKAKKTKRWNSIF